MIGPMLSLKSHLTVFRKCLLTSLFCLLISGLPCGVLRPSIGQSQSTEDAPKVLVVEATAILKDKHPERDFLGGEQIPFPVRFESKVSLDEIVAEKKYEIQLEVVNPTSLDFHFDQIQTGCLCSKGEFERNEFPSGTTTRGKLHMRMPASKAVTALRLEFTRKNPNGRSEYCGYIDLNFKISGHLAFRENHVELRSVDGEGSWSFPFTFSVPVSPASLQAEASSELRDAVLTFREFDENAGTGVLVMTLPSSMVDDYGIHGNVTLTDHMTGNKANMDVVLLKSKPYTFSPPVLRFKHSNNNEDHTLTANALFNVTPHPISKEGQVQEKKIPEPNCEIVCEYDGKPVKITSARIGKHVYRLTFFLPKTDVNVELDHLDLVIQIDGEKYDMNVQFKQ